MQDEPYDILTKRVSYLLRQANRSLRCVLDKSQATEEERALLQEMVSGHVMSLAAKFHEESTAEPQGRAVAPKDWVEADRIVKAIWYVSLDELLNSSEGMHRIGV
ncbi:hypothetical protein ATO8_19359 [Roseivivax marinus]|uniref:Uncharacterized protein n=1 Tax=Roseivivax marinus TaxID=1379903 RepID=W4HFV0_9RHOB|nr:hypothetical protein [Roseivivax marinus]ETW11011.1 hypothetical protein ATO8_19359 [Roseivivax marinus]